MEAIQVIFSFASFDISRACSSLPDLGHLTTLAWTTKLGRCSYSAMKRRSPPLPPSCAALPDRFLWGAWAASEMQAYTPCTYTTWTPFRSLGYHCTSLLRTFASSLLASDKGVPDARGALACESAAAERTRCVARSPDASHAPFAGEVPADAVSVLPLQERCRIEGRTA